MNQPSHADILDQITANERERDEFRRESAKTTHEIFRQLKDVSTALDGLKASVSKTETAVQAVVHALGEEPTTDGAGGRGLIGDIRKTSRDMQSLMDLRKMGLGAIGAVVLFGTLIVFGITYWIKSLTA